MSEEYSNMFHPGSDGKGKKMAENNLAKIGDQSLLNLFDVIGAASTTRRAKQVRAELERRGHIFEPTSGDYTTCAEWNQRHPGAPKNCNEEARLRENKVRDKRRLDG